jgi:hypothetical protein
MDVTPSDNHNHSRAQGLLIQLLINAKYMYDAEKSY